MDENDGTSMLPIGPRELRKRRERKMVDLGTVYYSGKDTDTVKVKFPNIKRLSAITDSLSTAMLLSVIDPREGCVLDWTISDSYDTPPLSWEKAKLLGEGFKKYIPSTPIDTLSITHTDYAFLVQNMIRKAKDISGLRFTLSVVHPDNADWERAATPFLDNLLTVDLTSVKTFELDIVFEDLNISPHTSFIKILYALTSVEIFHANQKTVNAILAIEENHGKTLFPNLKAIHYKITQTVHHFERRNQAGELVEFVMLV
ncbi:hypothetical protein D9613_004657 [Agrocybe pediades]|uniref:Uncharacterized protein n=1 Tax=Agrocybe pediades TaxID=84607 RepID=A0A8H4VQT2_9AGAR|nr:hypothetical protein D9613_004657 [Agrocybe pediades]